MNQLNATSTTPEQDAAELAAYLASPPWKGYVGTLEEIKAHEADSAEAAANWLECPYEPGEPIERSS